MPQLRVQLQQRCKLWLAGGSGHRRSRRQHLLHQFLEREQWRWRVLARPLGKLLQAGLLLLPAAGCPLALQQLLLRRRRVPRQLVPAELRGGLLVLAGRGPLLPQQR